MSKPTMSAHFAILQEAGLTEAERSGRTILYRLKMSVTGLAMIVIRAALPIAAARPVSLMLLVASILIVARRLASLLGTHRTTA